MYGMIFFYSKYAIDSAIINIESDDKTISFSIVMMIEWIIMSTYLASFVHPLLVSAIL